MNTNPVAAAEQVMTGLETQFAENEAAISRNADEREGIAFLALTGNAEAKARLDTLGTENASMLTRRADIEAALVEGRRRVGAAKLEMDTEAKREIAREARKLAPEYRKAAADLDECAQQLGRAIETFFAVRKQIERKGIPGAGVERGYQLATAGALSVHLRTALGRVLIELPLVAPSQRRTMVELIENPVKGMLAWADTVLADSKAVKAA